MAPVRESWDVVLQDDQGDEEHETVYLENVRAEPGGTIETTDGQRITFVSLAVPEAVA